MRRMSEYSRQQQEPGPEAPRAARPRQVHRCQRCNRPVKARQQFCGSYCQQKSTAAARETAAAAEAAARVALPVPVAAGEKGCRWCRGPLPNARAVFCSPGCSYLQLQSQREAHALKRGSPPAARLCPECGKPLTAARMQYCSGHCRQVAFRERHGLPGSAWEDVGLPADGKPPALPPGPPPRLAVELVPATTWFDNLRKRLPKSEWDRIRHQVYADAGNRCELCGGKGKKWPVECHERWRYDDDTHVQHLDGLIALCPSCHRVKHLGMAKRGGWLDGTMYHLQKVNGWDHDTTVARANAAFAIWAERSHHQWTVDASAVERQFGVRLSGEDQGPAVVAPAPQPSLPPDPAYESAWSAIGTALDLVLGPNAGKVQRVLATSPHTIAGLAAAVEAIALRPPPTGSSPERWQAAIAAMRSVTK